jgi:hypothetical protein
MKGMDPVGEVVQYTGPRPSPAKRWSTPLVVVLVVAAVGSATLLVLHLIERHVLMQLSAGHSVSRAFIDDIDSFANTVSRITTGVSIALLVLLVVWLLKRRSKGRLIEGGESSVEPTLTDVSQPLLTGFWVSVGLAIVTARFAVSTRHSASAPHDFINYRTYLAVADAFRLAGWSTFAVLVVKSTRRQDARENETAETEDAVLPTD